MTLMGSQEKGFSIFKRNHDHFKGKCYFYFLIQWVLLKSFRWKLEKKWFFLYFSDFECLFLRLAGVCYKCVQNKYFCIYQDAFFDTNLFLSKHQQQVFCSFFVLFFSLIIRVFRLFGSSDSSVRNFADFVWKSLEK